MFNSNKGLFDQNGWILGAVEGAVVERMRYKSICFEP